MNIHDKISAVKDDFHRSTIKKTGYNKFSNYPYFELADFLVPALALMRKHRLGEYTSFTAELATMTIVDLDKPEDVVVITSPLSSANLKACHEVQNVGACETYARRYLWTAFLQIVEHDALDAAPPPEAGIVKGAHQHPHIAKFRKQIHDAKDQHALEETGEAIKAEPEPIRKALRPAYVARQKALQLDLDDLATTMPGGE